MEESEINQGVIKSLLVLDKLDNIVPLYAVDSIERITEFSCKNQGSDAVHIWNGDDYAKHDVCQPYITNDQVIMLNFMFKEMLGSSQKKIELIFADYSNGVDQNPSIEMSIPLGDQNLIVSVDGEVYETYKFDGSLEWQAEEKYKALVHMDEIGCLDVMLWPKSEPESVIQARTCQQEWKMDFPTSKADMILNLSVDVPIGQALNISNLWRLDMSDEDTQLTNDENKTDTEETANTVDKTSSDDSEQTQTTSNDETTDEVIYSILSEYAVKSIDSFDNLECEVNEWENKGEMIWDASSEGFSDLCRPSLDPGQALVFDFIFWNDMDKDNNQIAWMLNPLWDQQDDVYDMELGINLSNYDLVEKKKGEFLASNFFDNEWEWGAGRSYSATIIFTKEGGVMGKLWRTDNPSNVLTSSVFDDYWMNQFLGELDKTTLQYGIWIVEGQSVSVKNMKLLEVE